VDLSFSGFQKLRFNSVNSSVQKPTGSVQVQGPLNCPVCKSERNKAPKANPDFWAQLCRWTLLAAMLPNSYYRLTRLRSPSRYTRHLF